MKSPLPTPPAAHVACPSCSELVFADLSTSSCSVAPSPFFLSSCQRPVHSAESHLLHRLPYDPQNTRTCEEGLCSSSNKVSSAEQEGQPKGCKQNTTLKAALSNSQSSPRPPLRKKVRRNAKYRKGGASPGGTSTTEPLQQLLPFADGGGGSGHSPSSSVLLLSRALLRSALFRSSVISTDSCNRTSFLVSSLLRLGHLSTPSHTCCLACTCPASHGFASFH